MTRRVILPTTRPLTAVELSAFLKATANEDDTDTQANIHTGGGSPCAMTFTVTGKVRGKGRPRFTRTGHCYTDAKTAAYEELIRREFVIQCRNHAGPVRGPMLLTVYVYMAIPKSKQREVNVGDWYVGKPDGDNVLKVVKDALNGLAYFDDSQVADECCRRMYDDAERLMIVLQPLPTSAKWRDAK